jgi:hypothetical protein
MRRHELDLPLPPRFTATPLLRRLPAVVSLLLSVFVSPAGATLESVSIAPSQPTTCDTVTITAVGELPPCFELVRAEIFGPEPEPFCMLPGPCPVRYRVELVVRSANPAAICPAVIMPYSRSFNVGKLRPGQYVVNASERVIPFSADSTDSIVDYSIADTTFTVRSDSTCTPGLGCYMLDFVPDRVRDPIPLPPPCTASAPPGGIACVQLSLHNFVAVGGLQATIEVRDQNWGPISDALIRPTSVDAVWRAGNFQAAWTAEGSKAKIILFSPTGQTIPPGEGPVLRICYTIAPNTPDQVFRVTNGETIVADPNGERIIACPTLVAPYGLICVSSAQGCDVNGDGVSDVLDIIQLVRCALATQGDSLNPPLPACPPAADCNGDGSVDIRDVICCVRKILEAQPGEPTRSALPIDPGAGESSIGFVGAPVWTSDVDGFATLRLDAAENWGGAQFVLNSRGAPVRVRGVVLEDASARPGVQLESALDGFGIMRVMIYDASSGPHPAHSYRIRVLLERNLSVTGTGTVRIQGMRAGSSTGSPAAFSSFNPSVPVDAVPIAAPALLKARPNPAAGQVEVGFVLPSEARVRLSVYDVGGRLVRRLIDGPMPAGIHRPIWDGFDSRGRSAGSGAYFTKLEVGATIRTERLLLLR